MDRQKTVWKTGQQTVDTDNHGLVVVKSNFCFLIYTFQYFLNPYHKYAMHWQSSGKGLHGWA
jgi:hypothetical protein